MSHTPRHLPFLPARTAALPAVVVALTGVVVTLAGPVATLTAVAPASAAVYQDIEQQLTVTVGGRIGVGEALGQVPISLEWDLKPAFGTEGGCWSDPTFKGQVTLRVRDRSTRTVGTWAISAKTGSAQTTVPANRPTTGSVHTARFDYEAFRTWPAGCETNPLGFDEWANRYGEVDFDVPYAGDEPCDWKVARAGGRARLHHDGESYILGEGDGVIPGDVVSTGKGTLALRSKRAIFIRLEPGSKMRLTGASCADSPTRFSWKLLFGRVWSEVTRLVGSRDRFEIETGNSGTGVRGTKWWTIARRRHGRSYTRVSTVEGRVEVRSLGHPARRVSVRAGNFTEVVGSGPPDRPRRGR